MCCVYVVKRCKVVEIVVVSLFEVWIFGLDLGFSVFVEVDDDVSVEDFSECVV